MWTKSMKKLFFTYDKAIKLNPEFSDFYYNKNIQFNSV